MDPALGIVRTEGHNATIFIFNAPPSRRWSSLSATPNRAYGVSSPVSCEPGNIYIKRNTTSIRMIRCLIRLRSAICCTEERSANATNNYVGKGSSPWCREFELERVISFDSYLDRTGARGQLQRGGGGTFDSLTGLVALSTFKHGYALGTIDRIT